MPPQSQNLQPKSSKLEAGGNLEAENLLAGSTVQKGIVPPEQIQQAAPTIASTPIPSVSVETAQIVQPVVQNVSAPVVAPAPVIAVTDIRPVPAQKPSKRFAVFWKIEGVAGPVLFFAVLALLVYSLRIGMVSGGSMEPALHEGDRIVVDTLSPSIFGVSRGEMIVFTNPHDTSVVEVKRVIGLPDEKVEILGGTISVTSKEGKLTEFPQGSLLGGNGDIADYSIQLGPEDYFVLGDNRSRSTDSRDFGAVQPTNIKGKVLTSFKVK